MIEVINAVDAYGVAFASRTKYLKKELELAISEGRNVLSVKEYKINSVDVAQLREYGYDIYDPDNDEIIISWGIAKC